MKKIFALTALCLLTGIAVADTPDNFYRLMSHIHATGTGATGVTGSPLTGAYAFNVNGNTYSDGVYDPNDGKYEFWSMNFGATQSIRKFTLGVDGSDWSSYFDGSGYTSFYGGFGDHVDSDVSNAGLDNIVGTSIFYALASDLGRVASADPDLSSGVCSTAIGGTMITGSFVLNPAPVMFRGSFYEAGQLALVTSGSGASNSLYRKVVLIYDLRQIGELTDREPDYNTGQDGNGNQLPIYGAYNQADWNDVFQIIATGKDILDSTGIEGATATTFNFGRQAVWAPDASAIYFAGFTVNNTSVDGMRYVSGIWKYDFATDGLTWIKRELSESNAMYYCEMAAIDTSVRDFTAGDDSGVQILYASETENVGGISCIIDNGVINPTVYNVLDAARMSEFVGRPMATTDIRNIVASPSGDIFFYTNGSMDNITYGRKYHGYYAIFRYDTKGRLSLVGSRAHAMTYNVSQGVSISGSSGAMGAYQYYPNLFGKEMLTYRSTPLKVPTGIELFHALDLNRDGAVDITDLEIFRDQRINNDRWLDPIYSGDAAYASDPDIMPRIFDAPIEYLNCDLNGNFMYRNIYRDKTTGEYLVDEAVENRDFTHSFETVTDRQYFNHKIVTRDDTEALYQFIPAGDADFNGSVDLTDFAVLAANYLTGNNTDTRKNFTQGDFDFDGDIDQNDLAEMARFWLAEYEPVITPVIE